MLFQKLAIPPSRGGTYSPSPSSWVGLCNCLNKQNAEVTCDFQH